MGYLNDGTYRAYDYMGCHWDGDDYRFRVWAPNAQAVSVVGDFNYWDPASAPMTRDWEGYWTARVPWVQHGQVYKYAITGPDGRCIQKADPFAFHSETGPATGSKVWDIDGYNWSDGAWMRERMRKDWQTSPINIYEVHLGSWCLADWETYPNYRNIAPVLADYCHQMGFTHVELMPITEFPFVGSWGYQVTGYFAPTSRYGTPQDFMAFVDILHQAGIGVLIDWVPAHFPKDEHGLGRFDGTPLFEYADPRIGEHAEWGTLVFDYASPDVRGFLVNSAMFFLEKYHVDGLRCDAVSSMIYLDYGRGPGQWLPNRDGGNINYDALDFWKQLNYAVKERFPGVIIVAEESTAYPGITTPVQYGGLGFDFKWNMGFMHDTLDYCSKDPVYKVYEHHKLILPTEYSFSERFILAYSHDEVVYGKGSMLGKMPGEYHDKFSTLRTLYGYMFGHPGKKLNFMGNEFAQFDEWNYRQQLDWMLLEYPKHRQMQDYYAALGHLYLERPALWQIDESWDGFTWLNRDDREHNCVAFIRWSRNMERAKPVVCVCNFAPMYWEGYLMGLPYPGRLKPLLNSDDERFGGWGCLLPEIQYESEPFGEFAQRARLNLPPLSAQFFELEEE